MNESKAAQSIDGSGRGRTRRGLTLVEVLAAVVLLAMLASAALPWLARASELAVTTEDRAPQREFLDQVAAAFLEDPAPLGVPTLHDVSTQFIDWRGTPSLQSEAPEGDWDIRVSRLREQIPHPRDGEGARDAWLLFELTDRANGRLVAHTVRWIPLPPLPLSKEHQPVNREGPP